MNNLSTPTELCELFLKYKADKCPAIAHSYSPHYYNILKHFKNEPICILEIGVGSLSVMQKYIGKEYEVGASLKAWRDFFPNAQIFGLDIDRTALFESDRIKCFYSDQADSESLHSAISEIRKYSNNDGLLFDIIIDDGSHQKSHMINSFETLSCYVKVNGFYIIEDIKNRYMRHLSNMNSQTMRLEHKYHGIYNMDNFVVYQKIK